MSTDIDQQRTKLRPLFAWLEEVLTERFGVQIQLSIQKQQVRMAVNDSLNAIVFTLDIATFSQARSDLPCRTWDAASEGWQAPLGKPLPAPGVDNIPCPLIEKREDDYHIGYDILGFTYWMLSRQEEVGRDDLDVHSRFPATSSHAFMHGYLERPIVDEWLHLLGQVIARSWPNLLLRNNTFSIAVSHDADRPSFYAFANYYQVSRAITGDLLKRRDLKAAMQAVRIWTSSKKELHPSDPLNTFDWLMDISERHGLISAFYFICGRTDPAKDASYNPQHTVIRALLRKIHSRGHELGLHPSYNTYRSSKAIAEEARRLKRVCGEERIEQEKWGGRMHYLRWEQPTTLRGWEEAGMDYDSTLGYADMPGFRCGTCFEYPAYDPVAGQRLALRIRPLIAMESSIIADNYLGLGTGEAALKKFCDLKNSCKAVNGCFTLLWHNNALTSQAERDLYQAILD